MFTNEMFLLIVAQTNTFATWDKNDRTFLTDLDEIVKLLEILIHSCYKVYPTERAYWSRSEGFRCEAVKTSKSRKRFILIKKYIHFADSQSLTLGNKAAKVFLLYN